MSGRKNDDKDKLISRLWEEVQQLRFAPHKSAEITLRNYCVLTEEGEAVVKATRFKADHKVVFFYRDSPVEDKYSWDYQDECFIQETQTGQVAVFWNPVSVVELTE